MRILVGYHTCYCVTGVTLNRLDIAAVQLQLVCNTGMTKAVKHNLGQIMRFDQFLKQRSDTGMLNWSSKRIRHNKIVIDILLDSFVKS